MIRAFTLNDYEAVYRLWNMTPGVGLRSMDDSEEGIRQLVRRNPTTNFVAEEDGRIIGAAFGGHDGRRGYLYHVCVAEGNRRRCIGRQLVDQIILAMKDENITRLALVCMSENEKGNHFWNSQGWVLRQDMNYYTLSINENNQ